jgi:hypothetical protein
MPAAGHSSSAAHAADARMHTFWMKYIALAALSRVRLQREIYRDMAKHTGIPVLK